MPQNTTLFYTLKPHLQVVGGTHHGSFFNVGGDMLEGYGKNYPRDERILRTHVGSVCKH